MLWHNDKVQVCCKYISRIIEGVELSSNSYISNCFSLCVIEEEAHTHTHSHTPYSIEASKTKAEAVASYSLTSHSVLSTVLVVPFFQPVAYSSLFNKSLKPCYSKLE